MLSPEALLKDRHSCHFTNSLEVKQVPLTSAPLPGFALSPTHRPGDTGEASACSGGPRRAFFPAWPSMPLPVSLLLVPLSLSCVPGLEAAPGQLCWHQLGWGALWG